MSIIVMDTGGKAVGAWS